MKQDRSEAGALSGSRARLYLYGPLLDENLQPAPIHDSLKACRKYLGADDRLLLKVPQMVIARKLHRSGQFAENPDYLNPELWSWTAPAQPESTRFSLQPVLAR